MSRKLDLTQTQKLVVIDGVKYKRCQYMYCEHKGKLQHISSFRAYKYPSGTTRYYPICNDCTVSIRTGFMKDHLIPAETIPPDVELGRGNVGANFGRQNAYRANKLSAILQRYVHFVDYCIDDDIMIAMCGRTFDDGQFDTSSDLLHYGKLCPSCKAKYQELKNAA